MTENAPINLFLRMKASISMGVLRRTTRVVRSLLSGAAGSSSAAVSKPATHPTPGVALFSPTARLRRQSAFSPLLPESPPGQAAAQHDKTAGCRHSLLPSRMSWFWRWPGDTYLPAQSWCVDLSEIGIPPGISVLQECLPARSVDVLSSAAPGTLRLQAVAPLHPAPCVPHCPPKSLLSPIHTTPLCSSKSCRAGEQSKLSVLLMSSRHKWQNTQVWL